MYPAGGGSFFWLFVGLVLVWLAILSYLIWQERLFLKTLFPRSGKTFKDKLEEVLKEVEGLEEFKRDSLGSVQKVTLKRYNPYRDTGGDQSFSLALLDGNKNGVVITSLHSRSGTRVFAKSVKGGEEDGFPKRKKR